MKSGISKMIASLRVFAKKPGFVLVLIALVVLGGLSFRFLVKRELRIEKTVKIPFSLELSPIAYDKLAKDPVIIQKTDSEIKTSVAIFQQNLLATTAGNNVIPITVISDKGEIDFFPVGGLNADAQTEGNKIKYIDAFSGADLEYELFKTMVKETIIVKSLNSQRDFSFQFPLPSNAQLNKDKQGGIVVKLGGQDSFYLHPIVAKDSVGKEIVYKYDLEKGVEGYLIKVSGENQEQFDDAVFPIIIDPTISWEFSANYSYTLSDPSKIEVVDGVLRLVDNAGSYSTDNPYGINNTTVSYDELSGFTETLGVNNQGTVQYQLSKDGTNWFWWNGSNWIGTVSGFSESNLATTINTNISSFHTQVGTGVLYFKAFLHATSNSTPVEISAVNVTYILTDVTAPTITSISPDSGSTAGGAQVTITGINFVTKTPATGGIISTAGGYTFHTFISNGTFTAPSDLNVEVLVVGGGGGGGGGESNPAGDGPGGGGAGGYREVSNFAVTAQSYNVTVGNGGAGASGSSVNGVKGGDSIFSTIVATGGGYGSREEGPGGAGGSGGGAGGPCGTGDRAAGAGNTPSTVPSQGNNGGMATDGGCSYRSGAGGGGAGGVGQNNLSNGGGGSGGAGILSSLFGKTMTIAGGGGGGSGRNVGNLGGGGQAGGGSGGSSPNGAGANAIAGTGSGGGGAGSGTNIGGAGGSGLVIIKYLTPVTTVVFGEIPAINVIVVNSTTITATVPSHTAGAVDVVVNNLELQATTLIKGFTYFQPTILAVNSDSGPTSGGTNVTITGTNFVEGAFATGGTITISGAYTIHTFNSSDTFNVPTDRNVEVLVVGGGGGGGSGESNSAGDGAGGGGAGGYLYNPSYSVPAGSHSITVGLGGAGAPGSQVNGSKGGDSVFENFIAIGGGYGAGQEAAGGFGGSGGGAGGPCSYGNIGGGRGWQGNNGGMSYDYFCAWRGGSGGGGSGGVGGNNISNGGGGSGGSGTTNSITGTSVARAGGGGGGAGRNVGNLGGSGQAGGGNGGSSPSGAGGNATANTGSGGGAAGSGTNTGGQGGSGVVIIKYLTPVTSVTFGGTTATNVEVVDATTITATVPSHVAGAVDVVVTNLDSQSTTLTNGFTFINPPTLTSILPVSASKEGGDVVVISGSDYFGTPTVTFDGIEGTSVNRIDSNTLSVVTPAHAVGFVDVVVTNPDGQADTLTSGLLYMEPRPTISSVTPNTGSPNELTAVTISGANFGIASGLGTGGTITTSDGYIIHTFTSSGTFNLPADSNVEFLVVGGGGGGGSRHAGGGGAGGVRSGTLATVAGNYSITIGDGGTAGSYVIGGRGGNGSDSVFSTITSIGGGGGGGYSNGGATVNGSSGGSGGGGAGATNLPGGSGTFGTGTAGQGNNGGVPSSSYTGGGGGGAGAIGNNASGLNGGSGGIGILSSITGSEFYYGGGGGGAGENNVDLAGGAGGLGGGGRGTGGYSPTRGVDGTANTGGGGGGSRDQTGTIGGSGIVVLKYLIPYSSTVTFDGILATNVVVVNDTTITATAPTHIAGSVDVVVTNFDTQFATLTNGFTYNIPPTVTSVTPSNVSKDGGVSIIISGSDFVGTPTVTFGGTPGTSVNRTDANTISVVTPAHVLGAVDVVVTNPDGGIDSLIGGFTYIENPPIISSITPNIGLTSGGTPITITGINFLADGNGTGGTITTSGGYTIHTFTSSGTFNVPNSRSVEVLVVAGGGGGGGDVGGGGGGGGVLTGTQTISGNMSVTIGLGGNGSGGNGGNSVFGNFTSIGGGGGGIWQGGAGKTGGSGGGGGGYGLGANGTLGQGNMGGTGWSGTYNGGSGGGAGSPGVTASNGNGSKGGDGMLSLISGSSVYYGGGGGAGGSNGSGAGGLGGGGIGVVRMSGPSQAGAPNTGGGGGGDGAWLGGGAGGSGIVIIRYLTIDTNAVTFDGVPASNIVLINSTTLTATTPSHVLGAVNVVITNYDGQSSTLINGFTYNPPTISSVSPNSGPITGGTQVTITGTNFIAGVPATGGTITTSGAYTINKFTSSGTLNIPLDLNVEVLVVGGGGGGGQGGGGAGGLINQTNYLIRAGTYTILVGSGGTAGGGGVTTGTGQVQGGNGYNSVIGNLFIAKGGGGGGKIDSAASAGGSGGGGGNGTGAYGAGTLGQGNRGGTGYAGNPWPGGAGGGAGAVGGNSTSTTGGAGGVGLQYSTSGTATYYAGGGGANGWISTFFGAGGNGGGGAGGGGGNGVNGVTNTGGGGGGSKENAFGGSGGSGIVIIKYLTPSTSLTFGGIPATNFVIDNSNSITATAPTHTEGLVDIVFTNPDGTTGTLVGGYTYRSAPIVTSVTPSSVSKDGGNSVIISGSNFVGTPTVTFGGTPGTFVNRTDENTISVVTPTHAIGFVDIVVTNPDGQSDTLTNGLAYTEPPTITSITPSSGQTSGGTDITITGTNFIISSTGTGGTITTSGPYTIHTFTSSGTLNLPTNLNAEVLVVAGGGGGGVVTANGGGGGGGGGVVYATSKVLNSGDTSITVGPSVATGTNGNNSTFMDITAIGGGKGANANTNGSNGGSGGGASANNGTPGLGTAGQGYAGGTQVSGTGHAGGGGGAGGVGGNDRGGAVGGGLGGNGISNSISGSAVIYGGGGGGGFGASGGTGGGGVGAYGVGTAVSGTNGLGGGGGGGYSTYGSGGGGSGVVIIRYLTQPSLSVTFGGTPATDVVVVNDTTITATAPSHDLGAVDLVVTNPDGTTATLTDGFTYLSNAFPTVTSVTPLSVSKDGGNSVVISGTSFFGTPMVTFGGTPGTFVNRTDANTISVVTPAHAVGFVDVVVTNPDERAGTLVNGLKYTENPPTISSISPNTGSTAGMTDVTISGTDFILGSPAIGGTITSSGGYTIHTFTSSSTFYTPTDRNVEVFVVGGGGGSSGFGSGGGGAGGVIYNPSYSATSGLINVTVGGGGAGASGSGLGNNGANSVFGTLTAIGGGTSGYDAAANGASGGSGGGAGTWAGNSGSGGSGTAGQGYVGGNQTGQHEKGGGGGGAGGPGWGGTSFSRGGDGGAGVASLISGTSIIYGGGGGGGVRISSSVSGGNGGLGGGGRGDNYNSLNGTAGTANTGGGGGGSQGYSNTTAPGHAGGSGIVIVRYLTPNANVTFGGIPAVNVTVVNPTTITATTPIHSAGAVDVVVTNTDGLSTTLTNGFTYFSLTISSISPDSGVPAGGTDITITGTNFVAGDSTFGGTITTSGDYTIHTFTLSGTFTVPTDRNVEVLVVGGGGGSSGFGGGGGGAGGVIYNSSYAVTQGIVNVTVGSGGVGAVASGLGSNGANSVFGSLTAIGGGTSGFDQIANGVTGGSGGGAGTWYLSNGSGGFGTINQGYAGGNEGSQSEKASGGGGAGGIGISGSTNSRGGDGGPGVANSISGTSVLYGGGGGGGVRVSSSVSGGNGGSGGGGRGDNYNSLNGTSGTANTGGGGGGSQGYSNTSAPGHSGGSGIVIVRYLTPKLTVALGGTLATNVVVVDSTIITATTPTHIPGYVDVVVTNSDGTIGTLTNGFKYNIPPTVTSVTPSSVSKEGGNSVIISGTGFVGTPTVTFDGTPGTFVNRTDGNTISVVTPAHAVGAVDVVVTNPDGGIGTLTNGLTYIEPPPTISSISPDNVSTFGGTEVTISGTNFVVSSPGTGGTITTLGPYTIHTFTSSGTFNLPTNLNAEVLVVAGGGGGANAGSGGGAGGYVYNPSLAVTSGAYTVTVGNGGSGGLSTEASGVKGGNSIFSSITAEGGGYGLSHGNVSGGNGGSGGGGPIRTSNPAATGGTGSQGSAGGAGMVNGGWFGNCGGGGGAGSVGGAGGNSSGTGNGGDGIANSITGSSIIYAGGGGGGEIISSYCGVGGSGGGGSANVNSTGNNGTNGLGGGGGGGSYYGSGYANGGNGGSGVVIIRYLTPSTTVTIDGSPVTNLVVVNSITITATTPAHIEGTVDVVVTNPDGGIGTLVNGLTYIELSIISNVSPNEGPNSGGTEVTITGTQFSPRSLASGGTIITSGPYTIHTFITNGTFSVPSARNVEVLVLGGGGGGGRDWSGGGGGAGGYQYNANYSVIADDYSVVVGDGGVSATTGNNSVFDSLTANGGGAGGSYSNNGGNGGCGGGGSGGSNSRSGGIGNQGYNGGIGYLFGEARTVGGGGGGTGTIGSNYNQSRNGGSGTANSISGSSIIYGGGGGGGSETSDSAGTGGLGGGGNGSKVGVGSNGTANRGGGGGGAGGGISSGGIGGSGIVIIRYLTASADSVTFGGTPATNAIVVNSTTITATTPSHTVGVVDVDVHNSDGTTATLSNGFTYNPTPTVTFVNPSSVSKEGGITITISGSDFVGTPTVNFGGVAGTSVNRIDASTISVVAPIHAVGLVDVVVINPDGGIGTLTNGLTYTEIPPTISLVSPNTGPIVGGTNVTITGANFWGDYGENTKLLLHNEGTGSSFVDSSVSLKTINAGVNATQSNTQAKFGIKSGYFDGSSYITTPTSADFDLGTANFTIDTWVYPTSVSGKIAQFGNSASNQAYTLVISNGILSFTAWGLNTGVPIVTSGGTSVPINQWTHVAISRSGSYFYLFINGNLVGTSNAYSGAISTGGINNVIGTGYDSNVGGYGYAGYFNGFIDEFRVTKGTARWTSSFSVSTRAYAQPNVTFGEVSATNIIVVDSTTITATTPSHISGPVDVVVTNTDGLAGTSNNGFTYVQELATKLKIISNPYSINAGNYTGAIQVEAQKNDNTPATLDADTIVTLALDPNSGTFKLEPDAGAIAVTQVTILESTSSAIFYYKNTTKGLYTISVSSVDLTSDTQDVTVDSASPSKLVFLSAPQTRQAGQESLQMRVQLQDAYNNSVNAQSNITIDLATSTLTGKFSITNGVNWLDTDMATIGTGSNDIFFYYKDTAMVNATLTVDEAPDIGIQSATQTYSIFAGSFARLGFSTVSQTLIAGQSSNAMVVTTYDIYGNVTTLDQETTFYLYSKKTSGSFSATNQFSSTITEIVIPADSSSLTFYYKDIVNGDAELIVSDQSTLDDPTDVGIVNAKQTQTINWGDPNKISLTNPNGAWTAGQGKALEINLQNQYDIIVPTDLSQIIYLYSSSQSGKYSLTNNFDPGDVIANILIPAHADGILVYYMETSAIAETLAASDNPTNPEVPDEGLTNSTLAVSILPADLVSFRFITSGQSLSAGQISGPVTIQSSDIYGNAKSVTGDVTVYFYSDSPTMEFSTVSDFASTATSAILNSGTTTLSFYVKDLTVGTHSIIASDYAILDDPDAGIVNAQQNILISEGTISQLMFSANLGQVIAGGISSPITVISQNQYGIDTPVLSNTTLYLFSSSLQGRFATSAGGPWDITTIIILQGQSSVEFYYRDGLFGDPTITVSDTASASPDITWTNAISTISVIPGEISQLAILTEPQSVIARHPSSNIQVQTQNMYGNPTVVSEITPIYLNSTSNQSEFFDPDLGIWGVSHKDMQIGQNTINFNYHDNLVGNPTLTFADSLPLIPDSAWTNASQQETITIQTINHISLTNISDPQEQGSSSSVIAQAQDSDNYVIDWYDGTVHFSSSDSDATLPSDYTFNSTIDLGTHTFANSVAFLHTGEKTVNIVDEHGITGSQVGITVTANSAGPISKVTIESAVSPLIINKNNLSGIITVKTLDTDNKPSNAPTGGFPVRVTSDKATGEFSVSSNGPWTSVGLFTIPQDLNTINFYYKDRAIGTPTLTVSDWMGSIDDPLILNDSLQALIKSLSISVDTSLLVNNNNHVDVLSQIIYAKDDTGFYYAKPSFNMLVTDETTGLSTNANLSITFKNPQGTIIETQQIDNVNNYIYTPSPISGTASEGNYTLEIQAINLLNGLTGTQTIEIPVSGWTIMVNYDPLNNYIGYPLNISASTKHNGVLQDPDNFSINLRDNNGYNLIDPQYTKQKNDMTRNSVGSYSGSMDTIGLTPNVAYFLSSRIYDLNNIFAEDSNYDIYFQTNNACDLITKAKIMNGLGADATEVDTLTMNVDTPVDFYVAGYDINNNFCNNTTLGTWTVTGFNGDAFAQINIPNASTISFNPHKAPATGTLVFTPATITGDTTGILTEETGNATSFEVTATTSTATVGVPFTTLDIVAKDQYGNIAVNSYNGTKTLTVTGLGVGPENDSPTATVTATFNNGLATILDTGITFVKAETVKVTITDNDAIYSPKPTGQSGNIIVSSGESTHFHIVSPSTVTAGTGFDITSFTAHDQYGNIATGYSGIKTITYTGPSIGLNNDNPTYTTSVNFTNGVSTTTLSIVLYKNETVKIHIADGSISGDSDDVTVQTGSPALISMISGDGQTGGVNTILSNFLVVKVEDSSGNFIENQVVQFSVTAGNGSVGSASPVTDANGLAQTTWRLGTTAGGVNTVQAVLNGVAGSPIVFTATATPAALSIFEVVAPSSAIAGTPFSVTVNAQDSLNNIDVNYFGTKIINFSGPAENGPTSGISAYPASVDFVNGSVTFQVTLVKAETVKITLTDNNSIYDPKPTGQSGDIVVSSGSPTHLHIISPTLVAIGTSFNLTSIVAHDLYGNIATGYSGSKTITYSRPGDKDGVHPSYTTSVNFTNGMSTTILTTILVKVELTTITVTDGTISGESEQIQVTSTQDFYLELVSSNNQTGTVGTMLAQDLVVAVYNRNGILTGGKTVQFNPTSGSATGSLTSDNVGLVTIRWTLGTSSGTQTATFSMVGISSTINFTASANVGPPFKVAFITGSKNIRVNAVSSQITVCLQDQYGNTSQPVSNNVPITLDGTSTTKSFATSATGPWGVSTTNIVIGTYCTNIYYKNSEPGNYELQVRADPDYQGDSQAIFVMPNELVLLRVTPDSFSLEPNRTQQMTAKLYNQDNVEDPNVTILWSMADGRAGLISQSGLFNSSNTPGVYLNAIKASYGSLEAFADVTVSSTTSTITPSVTRGPSTLTPAVTITPILTTTPTPTPTPSNLSNYMTILLNNYGNPIFITRSPYPVILSPKQGSLINGDNITISGTSDADSLIVLTSTSGQALGTGHSDYQGNWKVVLGADAVNTDKIQVVATIHGTSKSSLPVTFSIQQQDLWEQIRQFINAILNI